MRKHAHRAAASRAQSPAPGDMLLFHHPRGIATLISLFTRSPYYHVAIAIDADEVVEAMPNGVRKSSLAEKRGDRFYVIPPPDKAAGQAALTWAKSKIGDGYDPSDLLAIALDRVFAHLRLHIVQGDRFTCAEFVATAFAKAGVKLFPELEPQDIVPKDFECLLRRRSRR